jgi:hypothetical protein
MSSTTRPWPRASTFFFHSKGSFSVEVAWR